jgi:hypothetical protein
VQVTKSRIARGKQEILVQWKGLVAADGTWMTLEDFHKVYPSFQLEDELSLQGGGDVMWGINYTCHKKDSKQTGEKASAKKGRSQAGLKEAAI